MKKNLIVMLAILAALSVLYVAFEMLVPVQTGNRNVEVAVPKGASFREAADILAKENLIRDRKIFLLFGRLTGADRKIRAGFYSFWTAMSPLDIFRILRKGQIIEYEIKVIEGDSVFEIADTFARVGLASREEFLRLSKDPEFLATRQIGAPSFEGYVFPDTYMIPKGVSVQDAVGSMIDRMREKFTAKLSERAEEIGMTENQVLTLASIVEKEAAVDGERSLVSAVYHNRLRKRMPLQADPTSIYGIKSSKVKITMSDLRRKTPYNTYVVKGLPPGPIASPGLKSIIAALYPADAPFLYFVSNNDGTHVFSRTLAEHAAAVQAYREKKALEEEEEEEEKRKDEEA